MVEGMVRAADEDIKRNTIRTRHALEVIKFGEDLRREAQDSLEESVARKEEAENLLHRFQYVLEAPSKDLV